jgi:hypothetical protein
MVTATLITYSSIPARTRRRSGICLRYLSRGRLGANLAQRFGTGGGRRFQRGRQPRLCALQSQHGPNGDLVHEQQCFCWRRLRSDFACRMDVGWRGRFQRRPQTGFRLIQSEHAAIGNLVHEQQRACQRRVWAGGCVGLGVDRAVSRWGSCWRQKETPLD